MIIRTMKPKDIKKAISFTDSEKWNYSPRDFKLMIKLWPKSNFVIQNGTGKVLGIGSILIHGKLGWLSNFIIDKKERGKGYGKEIVKYALDYAYKKGVEYIGLYTYDDRMDFYSPFGFEEQGFYTLYIGKIKERNNPDSIPSIEVSSMDRVPLKEIIKFDGNVFGLNRSEFLVKISKYCKNNFLIMHSDKKIMGYILSGSNADGSQEISQWIATTKETARTLIIELSKKTGQKEFWLLVPWDNPSANELVKEFKFKPVRNYVFMSQGKGIENRKNDLIYTVSGLEIW